MSEETTTGNNNRTLLIVLIAVVVLLLAAVAFFLLRGDGVLGGVLGGNDVSQPHFITQMNNMVLRPQDFSNNYQIAAAGDSRFDNDEASGALGAEKGRAYIMATGRVDGWDLYMERSDPQAVGPESIRSRVEIYETSDGASAALSDEYFWAYNDESKAPDEFLDKNCNVGNECISFKYIEAKPGSGSVVERYDVAFRYRNTLGWVFIKGLEGEVSEQMALDYAQMVLARIEAIQ